MPTDRLGSAPGTGNALGEFLKSCRARRDPTSMGFPMKRRRTPGLRREEVAQLANVSATWYTWLEQGRGGTPSADVLEGIACALALTLPEREYLFRLAQGRPPEVRPWSTGDVSFRLQRILDSLETSPAYVKDSVWDVLASNRAAAALFRWPLRSDGRANILENLFLNPRSREHTPNWCAVAKFCVAAFRADAARSSSPDIVRALVQRLCRQSESFEAFWMENEVGQMGEGTKTIHDPIAGPIGFEYSSFQVEGQPELSLVIFTPRTSADVALVRKIL